MHQAGNIVLGEKYKSSRNKIWWAEETDDQIK